MAAPSEGEGKEADDRGGLAMMERAATVMTKKSSVPVGRSSLNCEPLPSSTSVHMYVLSNLTSVQDIYAYRVLLARNADTETHSCSNLCSRAHPYTRGECS